MFPAPANDKSAGGIGATGLTASGFGERNLHAGPPAKLKLGSDMEVCASLAPLRESAGSLFSFLKQVFPMQPEELRGERFDAAPRGMLRFRVVFRL
jgi:hypothetical protein